MKDINLLPTNRQRELYYETILESATAVLWISILSFVLVFVAQFGVKIYLQNKSRDIDAQIKQLQGQVSKDQNAKIKAQIGVVNSQISEYQDLAGSIPKWSKVLLAFAPLPPAGLSINSFSVDAAQKSVTINGHSPTRELVLRLYNNIRQDDKDFYNIDYPLENLINATNVSFHYTFLIRAGLLK